MLESLTHTDQITLAHSYGFDDVSLVPGMETLDPELCNHAWSLDSRHTFDLPILAAAMDGVVDPDFAVQFHPAGRPRRAQSRGTAWSLLRSGADV